MLLLRAGDRVPADARLLEAANLRADEASLTGESTAVEKDARARLGAEAGVGDRRNMVFAGTVVVYGRGQAVVTATGMQTEFGRIAKMLQEVEEEPSPLAVKMDYIGKRLGTACLAVSAAVVALGIFRGNPPLEMLIWGVSLAIAAVPEALAAVVTGALAIGVQRAARRRAIIRRLPAVETLGCTTVICSDKTGTLTRNEMTVRQVFASGQLLEVTGVGYDPAGEFRANGTAVPVAADPAAERLLAGRRALQRHPLRRRQRRPPRQGRSHGGRAPRPRGEGRHAGGRSPRGLAPRGRDPLRVRAEAHDHGPHRPATGACSRS